MTAAEYSKPSRGASSSPCFPAGTLVLTDTGLVPIEKIEIGDRVLTHMNRFRCVRAVESHKADTIILSGYGHHGLECTPNHPFYAIESASDQASWIDADEMEGKCWANIAEVPELEIPPMDFSSYPTADPDALKGFTSLFFYFVGQYLGAGKLVTVAPESGAKMYKMLRIRTTYGNEEDARRFFDGFGIKYTVLHERTSCEFVISAAVVYDWLEDWFGDDVSTKTLPAFVYGMPEKRRRALLLGYQDARRPYYEAETRAKRGHELSAAASKSLAVSMKILAGTLGTACDVGFVNLRHHRRVVESATSNPMPFYQNVYANADEADQVVFTDGKWFGRVEEKGQGRRMTEVFSLDVDDDDSYTADGIFVHNCNLM